MTAKTSYIVDRVLHWVAALAILLLLTDMGTRIHYVDYEIKGIAQHKQDAVEIHMTYALVLFVSMFARLFWRKFYLHSDYQLQFHSTKHKLVVTVIHSGMYLVLGLLMVTGFFMVSNYEHALHFYQLFTFSDSNTDKLTFVSANDWHLWFESLMYFLLIFHIAGAIYNRR